MTDVNGNGVITSFDSNVLLFGGYAEATRSKYIKAVNSFSLWCESFGYVPSSVYHLDYYLAKYLVYMWYTGKGKAEGSCALYGLDMLIPGLRSQLVWSQRSLRGYSRLLPSQPYPPLPYTVTLVISSWLAYYHSLSMAIGVILSFDCYLRAGELLNITYDDIASGRDARLGMDDDHRVHIHLRRTKTGNHKGVEVRDPYVKSLLLYLKSRHHEGAKLFPWHRSTYLRWFHKACIALHLSTDYVHHSLRHGGATRDYLNGVPIADVMVAGLRISQLCIIYNKVVN
jgi:integrase